MTVTNTAAAGLVRPDQVGEVLIEPIRSASVAFQVSTNITTTSASFRIPRVIADAGVVWSAEGSDIDPTDPTIDELVITPSKAAALVKVSQEAADDTSPGAAAVVGDGLARNLARKIDQAYFGNTTANGPSGLLSLSGVQEVDAGSLLDLDWAAEAKSKLENVGSTATAFCASANTVLHLSQLRTFDGATTSNEPLLGSDATSATGRTILGVPLYSLPAGVIDDYTIWALDKAKSFVVLREGAQVEVDRSFYFGSNSLAVRAIVRVGVGWPQEAAVVKIGWGDGS